MKATRRRVWIVGALAAVALLWPSRLSSPFDGVPLDGVVEALLIGVVFPLLLWIEPLFLLSRPARGLVIALLAWKAFGATTLVQDGWCVQTIPSRPYTADATGKPHSWDVRADWRAADPACSAIMTRPYRAIDEFPVWFFNLPPAVGIAVDPHDVPPDAVSTLRVRGVIATSAPGAFRLVTTPSVRTKTTIDDRAIDDQRATILPAGEHRVAIDAELTGKRWQLVPLWNDRDLFGAANATVSPPRRVDRIVRPWGGWITAILGVALLVSWLASALSRVRDAWTLAWSAAAATAIAALTLTLPGSRWHIMVASLAIGCWLPIAPRNRNLRGLFWRIGVPWLAFVVVLAWPQIGRLTLYQAGNDFWRFQRWAYRIYLQGYWLEGGEPTFWFQPLYRWIAGALHLVFGDSSAGEFFWDGLGLFAMAAFAFEVTRRFAGFRWGTLAAVATLALFLAGPGYVFIGRGLSEITSAAFIYVAALLALRSRHGSWRDAIGAGVCAALASYTRLNNLPMAAAVALFAWPVREPALTLWRPSRWFARASVRTIAVIASTLAIAFVLFAWRTWHYTGVFSVFHATALDATRGVERRTWQPGMSWSAGFAAMFESVMVVLTTAEPPHVHTGSLPLVGAAIVSLLAVARVPLLSELPANVVLLCLSSLVGALVARGTAYSGRFSIHFVPVASAVMVCALASVVRRYSRGRVASSVTRRPTARQDVNPGDSIPAA